MSVLVVPAYAELHCLTNYSFLRGAAHPEELVARAHALGYAALAVTDECSVAGAVRAHQAAKALGLPLLVGSEIHLHDGPRLVLLATDRAGYGRLCTLITTGRRRSIKGEYRLERTDLDDGLPGCLALLVPPRGLDLADEALSWFAATFVGRGWLAAQLLRDGRDARQLERLSEWGARYDLPLVASGGVHMHVRGRRPLKDLLTAIRRNTPVAELGLALQANGERHLRARDDLASLYPPALLVETLAVAARCRFSLDEIRYEYPDDVTPPGQTPRVFLRRLTEQGMQRRWPDGCPDSVKAQIEHELALIAELHYEASISSPSGTSCVMPGSRGSCVRAAAWRPTRRCVSAWRSPTWTRPHESAVRRLSRLGGGGSDLDEASHPTRHPRAGTVQVERRGGGDRRPGRLCRLRTVAAWLVDRHAAVAALKPGTIAALAGRAQRALMLSQRSRARCRLPPRSTSGRG